MKIKLSKQLEYIAEQLQLIANEEQLNAIAEQLDEIEQASNNTTKLQKALGISRSNAQTVQKVFTPKTVKK